MIFKILLQRLQPLVDIQDTLTFLADDKKLETLGTARSMLARWHVRMPSPDVDELHVWHMASSIRCLCLDRITSVRSAVDISLSFILRVVVV